MAIRWRRRNGGCVGTEKTEASRKIDPGMELTIPTHFRCPISLDLMKDPVTLSTGITYDRESIDTWIDVGNITCPVTNQILRNLDQIPNHSIRKMIQDWCIANKPRGIERIPTPRIPITGHDVMEICSRMKAATRCGDVRECGKLLRKIKDLAKESERNKRCLVRNGIGTALADSFDSFSCFLIDSNIDLLKEIVSTLTWAFPLDQEGISKLSSDASLHCMVRLLKGNDDLSSRQTTIIVLQELLSSDQDCIKSIVTIGGIEEPLFHIVNVPICPKATKAAIVIIQHILISSSLDITALKFVQMGLIPTLLNILIDGDKSMCEKALGIMDSICTSKEGREGAFNNALTIPLLVKKVLHVSNGATEFAVSTLQKLCLGENENALVEAMRLGAFQKLLVVLQIGSGERTKEKVTELLKLINLHRERLECFDSSVGLRSGLKKSE